MSRVMVSVTPPTAEASTLLTSPTPEAPGPRTKVSTSPSKFSPRWSDFLEKIA
jgi:hypothetical protein